MLTTNVTILQAQHIWETQIQQKEKTMVLFEDILSDADTASVTPKQKLGSLSSVENKQSQGMKKHQAQLREKRQKQGMKRDKEVTKQDTSISGSEASTEMIVASSQSEVEGSHTKAGTYVHAGPKMSKAKLRRLKKKQKTG